MNMTITRYLIIAVTIFSFATVEVVSAENLKSNNSEVIEYTIPDREFYSNENINPFVLLNKEGYLNQIKSAQDAHSKVLFRPFVRIYASGEIKQTHRLRLNEWEAIEQAVEFALIRVNSALGYLDNKEYGKALEEVDSAILLLTLAKIATPTFEVTEIINDIKITRVEQSLFIITLDDDEELMIIDVPLLLVNLINAQYSIQLNKISDSLLFLTNAQGASFHEE
jgi:hypothetical protein